MTKGQLTTFIALFATIGVTTATLVFKDGSKQTINVPATQPTTSQTAPPTRPAGLWASDGLPPITKTVNVSNTAQLNAAISGLASGTVIRCAAGTYGPISASITKTNVIITGAGDATIFTGGNAPIVTVKGTRVWIERIKFDGPRCHAIDVSGRDLNVVDCSVTKRTGYFVNVGASAVGVRVLRGRADSGVTDNFFYSGQFSQYVELLDCSNPAGSVNEHCFRIHSDHARVIGCTFAMNLRDDDTLKGFQSRIGSDHYIGFNHFSGKGSQMSIGPLFDSGNAAKWLRVVTIEYNDFVGLKQFQITEGVTGLTIRDNSIDRGAGTVFSVQASQFRDAPPAGVIERNATKGSTFIGGDSSNRSKLKLNANTMNGAKIAA